MSHQCPAPQCETDVDDAMLMCRPHWYQVPKPLRTAVWRAWRNGNGMGSAEHYAAMKAAIRSLYRLPQQED